MLHSRLLRIAYADVPLIVELCTLVRQMCLNAGLVGGVGGKPPLCPGSKLVLHVTNIFTTFTITTLRPHYAFETSEMSNERARAYERLDYYNGTCITGLGRFVARPPGLCAVLLSVSASTKAVVPDL